VLPRLAWASSRRLLPTVQTQPVPTIPRTTISHHVRTTALLLVASLVLVALPALTAVWLAPRGDGVGASNRLIVYYANETLPDLAQSTHYKLLFRALEASGSKRSRRAIDGIRHDLRVFPKLVEKEVATLLRHARRLSIHARVFTNRLAVTGRYLRYRPGDAGWRVARAPAPATKSDRILSQSPLSRQAALRAALLTLAQDGKARWKEVVLITSSHGDDRLALMPRVSTDLRGVSTAEFLRHFEGRAGQSRPAWGRSRGTTKTGYWKALAEAAKKGGFRYDLVYRYACRSGVSTKEEYEALPRSVRRLAHYGTEDVATAAIDLNRLLSAARPGAALSPVLAKGLQQQGAQLSVRRGTGNPVIDMLWRLSPALLFLPLIVWLLWAFPAWRRRK